MTAPLSEDLVDAKAKRLGDELAYPCLPPLDPNGGGSAGGYPYPEIGMRKRELFAMHIHASICAVWPWKEGSRAVWAVRAADELLKELAR